MPELIALCTFETIKMIHLKLIAQHCVDQLMCFKKGGENHVLLPFHLHIAKLCPWRERRNKQNSKCIQANLTKQREPEIPNTVLQ